MKKTLACLLALTLCFLCRTSRVEGYSMNPTLRDGQFLLMSAYSGPLRHGDIAVVSGDGSGLGKTIVKRVIGLPGDVIDIDFGEGVVYRNGEPLREPYTAAPTTTRLGMPFPLTVEPGKCFLMGDNRNHSTDSRSPQVGQVDQRDVMRVIFPK
jgi:signal peptidase I